MHAKPASPKKPCWATMDGRHQWAGIRTRPWRRSLHTMCWICGARKLDAGNYGEEKEIN